MQVRRDLAAIGFRGTRGLGYVADDLIKAARDFLGLRPVYHIALVGAGRLGSALAGSDVLARRGFVIRDAFDTDPYKVGRTIGDVVIQHVDELERRVAEAGEIIGIIAVPPNAAQEVADRMVRAGIRIILNYTEVLLRVPEWMDVHRVDPVGQLMYTLYYLTHVEGQQDPYRS